MNKEAKVLMLSFFYFANILEENREVSRELLALYRKLGKLTMMYQYKVDEVVAEINEAVKDYPQVDVDILLTSVSIIAEYYEQMLGKKRLFTPMSHKEVLRLQLELMDEDEDRVERTLDYCKYVVEKLLK